ncbi:MAG: FHA domain-containing protein [Sedimentisphaerales bacterium]|nr:FHA domain-containing protein [Sedimentisphaerales bacterium]
MDTSLVVFTKHGRRKDIKLKRGISIIGRRNDCDIYIPHAYISRKHCRIIQQEDKLVVQDLGSANGTFLNNQRIMEGVLCAGDTILVGTLKFTVQIDGKPETIQPDEINEHNQAVSATTQRSQHNNVAGDSGTVVPQGTAANDPLADLEPLAGDIDLDDSSIYKV